jgi:hypothetical protein
MGQVRFPTQTASVANPRRSFTAVQDDNSSGAVHFERARVCDIVMIMFVHLTNLVERDMLPVVSHEPIATAFALEADT